MAREQREYVIAATSIDLEMPPPAKKAKTTKKVSTSKAKKDSEEDVASDAKNGDSEPGTPRNAATPGKSRRSPKRKASDVNDANESPESQKSVESTHDSVPDISPPAKKAKEASKTRNIVAKYGEPAGAWIDDDAAALASPSTKKPANKKRKAAAKDTSNNGIPEDGDADGEASPPTKKPKRAPPKTARKGNSKKQDEPVVHTAPTRPPAAQLDFVLAAKVRHVQEFIDTVADAEPALTRDDQNSALVSVPELNLTGALMRMCADYGMGGPSYVQVSDIDAAIVNRFTAPVGALPDQKWVTIDMDKRTDLENKIQAKVHGHGLEGTNLIELELEMFARVYNDSPPERLPAPTDMQRTFDAIAKKVEDDRVQAEAEAVVADGEREAKASAVDGTKGFEANENQNLASNQAGEVVANGAGEAEAEANGIGTEEFVLNLTEAVAQNLAANDETEDIRTDVSIYSPLLPLSKKPHKGVCPSPMTKI